MEKYFIDFEGYCEIEAENAKQAEDKFWEMVNSKTALPHAIYEIDNVDERY